MHELPRPVVEAYADLAQAARRLLERPVDTEVGARHDLEADVELAVRRLDAARALPERFHDARLDEALEAAAAHPANPNSPFPPPAPIIEGTTVTYPLNLGGRR